jgi:phage protein D
MGSQFLLKTESLTFDKILANRALSIVVEDADGFNEDFLCVDMVDDKKFDLPKIGSKIEASLGIEGDLVKVGRYFLRNIEATQDRLVFKYFATKLVSKTPKERAFKNKKLVDLLQVVAEDDGLDYSIDHDLKDLEINEYQRESNVNFLSRIGKDIGCITKVCDGKVLLTRRNGKTTDEKDLPEITIQNILDWNYKEEEETAYTGVRTHYWSGKKKKPLYYMEGKEGNVLQVRQNMVTKLAAMSKAKAKFREIKKASRILDFTCFSSSSFNTARVVCGAPIRVSGLRKMVPELWLVRKVTHQLTKDGLIAHIEGEVR